MKCLTKNRSDIIRWWGKWNKWTVSITWLEGTNKKIYDPEKKTITKKFKHNFSKLCIPKIILQSVANKSYAIIDQEA